MPINHHRTVNFPEHLAALREQGGMTQQQLADRVGVHVVQLRRYEAGTSQLTPRCHSQHGRGSRHQCRCVTFRPRRARPDDALKLQFEAKKVVQQVLDSMILQQEARRWSLER